MAGAVGNVIGVVNGVFVAFNATVVSCCDKDSNACSSRCSLSAGIWLSTVYTRKNIIRNITDDAVFRDATKPDVGRTEIADADSSYGDSLPFAIIEIVRVANAIFIMIECAASEGSICFDRNRGSFGPIFSATFL